MAFAPLSTYFPPVGNGTILGQFREKEYGAVFEYSKATEKCPFSGYEDYNTVVWFEHGPQRFRWAKVMNTVAYIIVDEKYNGEPITEKWMLKNHRKY